MKLAKGSGAGVSDREETDPNVGPQQFRKEELQVNPILGHHRLCDRNSSSSNAKSSLVAEQGMKPADAPSPNLLPSTGSFNNTLIKNIKVSSLDISYFGPFLKPFHPSFFQMSEHMSKSMNRPRLCSIRITQEGAGAATANILLEPNADMDCPIDCETVNIISQQKQVENPSGKAAIEQQVYTKRSKYLDEELDDTKEVIVCVDNRAKASAAAASLPTIINGNESPGKLSQALIELNNRTDSEKFRESVNNNNNTLAGDQSAFLMDDPVPVVNLQVMDMTTNNNNNNFNNVPKNNSNSLRQEQLDRVAVWVQQSNEQKQQKLHSTGSVVTAPAVGGTGHLLRRKSSNHSELTSSNAATVKELNRAEAPGDVCIDIIDYEEASGAGAAAVAGLDSDIAQMEYNVKKFLLKQNEWSIGGMKTEESCAPENHPHSHNAAVAAAGYMYSPSSSMSFASLTSNLRTETNL